jgi:5-methylcytosine-specific restriction endonuclease McrA
MIKKICPICNKEFQAERRNRKVFCSKKCFSDWRYSDVVNNEIAKRISNTRKGKPVYSRRKGKICNCKWCGKSFYKRQGVINAGGGVFCSRKCKGEYTSTLTREKALNWQGGKHNFQTTMRELSENRQWIQEVLKQQHYTCQECGQVGYMLHAHHKRPLSELIMEFLKLYSQFSPFEDKETLIRLAMTHRPFWDIDNGVCLCEKCHKKIHKLRSLFVKNKENTNASKRI